MSLESLAYLAEIVGGIGVIASLIFVGFQIRQNAQATRAATMASVMEQWAQNYQSLSENKKLAEVVWTGAQDPNAVTGVDRWRFTMACSRFFHYWHNAYYQWTSGSLDSNTWSGQRGNMVNLLTLPGVRTVWNERKHVLPENFQTYVETEILTKSPDADFKLSGT